VVRDPHVVEEAEGRIISTTTPTRLSVSFEENQAPVDMASLDVSASKGFFSKSLTSLLKPYVAGTDLRVDQLEIPTGRFLITIEIADAHGEKTAETFRLDVSAR